MILSQSVCVLNISRCPYCPNQCICFSPPGISLITSIPPTSTSHMPHGDTYIPSRGDFSNVFQMPLLYPKPSQSFLILLSNSTSIFSVIPQIFPDCLQRFQGTVLDPGNTRVEVGDCSFLVNLGPKKQKQTQQTNLNFKPVSA